MKVLEERQKTYGDFEKLAARKRLIRQAVGNMPTAAMTEALSQICTKLARISHTPKHVDSWRDIAGYATLIVNILEKENE